MRKAEKGFAFLIASSRFGTGGRSCCGNSCTAGAAEASPLRAAGFRAAEAIPLRVVARSLPKARLDIRPLLRENAMLAE